jgi:CBS domain-containing protein
MRIDALGSMIAARLVVIAHDTPVRRAAAALSTAHIGIIVVCDETGRAVGVVSKSDLIRHLSTMGVADTPVSALMSRNIISCRPEDDLYATWQRMSAQSLQNMPLLSADLRPLGVLDVRDALTALLEQEKYEERLLFNYVTGIGYQ